MSYVVLARKWRPQRFEDLTGQEHVARTLCNAIEQGRTPHAMLFTGARGVGKTTTARLVAMALNCAEGPTTTPCGVCDSCVQIQQSQSVDVLEIDGASNRGINEIRELREGVRYAPSRDRSKVYIIDEVHMLTTEAFNALLKTLEEPPEHVVFVFATTEAQKIPVTILSRCQRFDFRRIPHAEIVSRLSHIAESEELEIDPEVLAIVARQAAGGMRDALSLLDQVIAFCGNSIRLEDAESILGAAERRRLFELSDALFRRDVEGALRVVDAVDSFGADIAHFSTELVAHLRDLAIVAATRDPSGLVMLTDRELADAREQVGQTDVSTLHSMFEIMVDSGENIARSNHPKLLFEMALVRMVAIEPVHNLTRLAETLEALADGKTMPPPSGGSGGPAASGGSNEATSPDDTSGASAAGASSADLRSSGDGNAEPPSVQAAAPPSSPETAATRSEPTPEAPSTPSDADAAPADLGADQATTTSAQAVEATGEGTAQRDEPALLAQDDEQPTVGEAIEEVRTILDQVTPALSATVWRETVGALRKEQPHAGELIASAYAVPTDSGVKLGLEPALLERVDGTVLERLNSLCAELGGGSQRFTVTSRESLEQESTNGYSVVETEKAEQRERQAAAENYVRTHEATTLLMSRFPGSRIERVTIPEAR